MDVQREIVLPAPREEVWEALTEAEHLEGWFATEVELDLREGGEGRFRWSDGETREAVVEDVEPLRRLAFTWSEPGRDASRVELTLDDDEDGTRVTVVESLPAPEATAEWAPALELRALVPALV